MLLAMASKAVAPGCCDAPLNCITKELNMSSPFAKFKLDWRSEVKMEEAIEELAVLVVALLRLRRRPPSLGPLPEAAALIVPINDRLIWALVAMGLLLGAKVGLKSKVSIDSPIAAIPSSNASKRQIMIRYDSSLWAYQFEWKNHEMAN